MSHYPMFAQGTLVRTACGDTYRVMYQRGCQVFVGPNTWFHPTKLYPVESPRCEDTESYDRDLALRVRNGQVGSGMRLR